MNIPNSLKDMVKEQEPELEHRKYADFYASWSYTVTIEDIKTYGDSEWLPFIGKTIVANGMRNDEWGSEVYDWDVYESVIEQSQMGKDFAALMSHLNAEENPMACAFYEKYIPNDVKLVKVVDDE